MAEKRNTLLMGWRMARVGWHLVSGCTQIAVFFGRSSQSKNSVAFKIGRLNCWQRVA